MLFADGLKRTFDWYIADEARRRRFEAIFDFMLTGRGKAAPVTADKA